MVKIDTYNGVSKVRKRFLGVTKHGNKWRALIQNPKLKIEIYLGHYDSPEEAALSVKKKNAEFGEMVKDDNSMNVGTCKDDFEGRVSVYKMGCGRWGARIWHPKLKYNASLGSYNTREEAAVAVANRSAKLWKMCKWRMKGKALEEAECGVVSLSKISDELTSDLKVPAGVSKLKGDKWSARIRDPVSGNRIWLGTFNTAEEAVRSLNKSKAELAVKRKRVEFDGYEFCPKARPGSDTNEAPMKVKCELGYVCPTSVLGADDLNSIAVDGKSNHGVANVADKLEVKFVDRSPTSAFEPEKSINANVSKGFEQISNCASDFDEAMRWGFINEYGQLLGKYSELDEHTGFSLPDVTD